MLKNTCTLIAVTLAVMITGSLTGQAKGHRVRATVHELTPDFNWGYRRGVKQSLGAYKDGLSIHQLSRATGDPPAGPLATPDYILWVDEKTGTFGYEEEPTGAFSEPWHNPGGQAVFGEDGTIWFAHGAHLPANPMKLFRSDAPFDPSSFTTMVNPLVAEPIGSTTPCLTAIDADELGFFWRNGRSSYAETGIRFRRYGVATDFSLANELEVELGLGEDNTLLGVVGMEQLWTRHDPRHGVSCVSWQWFEVDIHRFGSSPFLSTDDGGTTWRRADGTILSSLPLLYSDIDEILVPDDHLGSPSDDTSWYPAEVGVTPEGAAWMAQPKGRVGCCWDLMFWRFGAEPGEDPGWRGTVMASMGSVTSSYACGATENYMVCVYSTSQDNNVLQARVSSDDGRTWGEPFVVDTFPSTGPNAANITWASFAQPADDYDNTARFFYTYSLRSDGSGGANYRNKVRFISLGICGADLDDSGDIGFADLTAVITAWGPCEGCPVDLDGNGDVGFTDLVIVLGAWGPCP